VLRHQLMVRTLAFVIVRRVAGLVGLRSAPDAKDIEIAVLRHQLMCCDNRSPTAIYAAGPAGVSHVGAAAASWVVQAARNLLIYLDEHAHRFRFHLEFHEWHLQDDSEGVDAVNADVVGS
jgi:hypothetical protein